MTAIGTYSNDNIEAVVVLAERSIAAVEALAARWHRARAAAEVNGDGFNAGRATGYAQAISLLTDVPYREVVRQLVAGVL